MKGFIEVTSERYCDKRLVAIGSIREVREAHDGGTEIITDVNKRSSYGFIAKESYAEVVQKIEKAIE